jgi:hypothetical protein
MSENKFELIIENGVVTGYKGESTVVEIPEGVTAEITLPSGYKTEVCGGIYHFAE